MSNCSCPNLKSLQLLVVEDGAPVLGLYLTRSSSGVYVCVATNAAGEGRVELRLIVEGEQLVFKHTHMYPHKQNESHLPLPIQMFPS